MPKRIDPVSRVQQTVTPQVGQMHFEPFWAVVTATLSGWNAGRLLALYPWLPLLMACGFALSLYFALAPGPAAVVRMGIANIHAAPATLGEHLEAALEAALQPRTSWEPSWRALLSRELGLVFHRLGCRVGPSGTRANVTLSLPTVTACYRGVSVSPCPIWLLRPPVTR